MKRGLAATKTPIKLQFSQFYKGISIPDDFGHEDVIHNWGVLGNDRAGCCVWAGIAHQIMLWNKLAGQSVPFSDASVLKEYSTYTGYKPYWPLNLFTDWGTSIDAAMKIWRQNGMRDHFGTPHKIAAYFALKTGDPDQLKAALYLCDSVAIGLNLPAGAESDFQQRRPWTSTTGIPIGGHYVPAVALRKGMFKVITWGGEQKMSPEYYNAHSMEAVACISLEAMVNGKSPEGLDLPGIKDAVIKVTAK